MLTIRDTMKKFLILSLLLVAAILVQAAKVELSAVTKNASKYAGKAIEFKGVITSACPKNDKRFFVSPSNDRSARLAVVVKKGLSADMLGKSVTVKGVLKKAAYVAPKPCGRCDGSDCAKSISEGTSATYYVEATSVK